MPYTNEQWEYFSSWKNYSKEKDLQYSEQEFDFFLNRLKLKHRTDTDGSWSSGFFGNGNLSSIASLFFKDSLFGVD